MIEYITNIYIFPFIGVILGLFIYHMYHKIDDKTHISKKDYLKCCILIYIVCFLILFLYQNMIFISPNIKSLEIQDITDNNDIVDIDNMFSTGYPTF